MGVQVPPGLPNSFKKLEININIFFLWNSITLESKLSWNLIKGFNLKKKYEEFRSARWFAPNDVRSFGHRSRAMQMGLDKED